MNKTFLRLLCFFFILVGGVLGDLWTKNWIFGVLGTPGEKGVWWLIPQIFGFQTSLNQGALFGLGQGQIPLFVVLSFLALIALVLMVIFDSERSLFIASVLGMIGAGILGNLWDRLGLHQLHWTEFHYESGQCIKEMVGSPIYGVRDWILVMFGDWPWPNFNLADSYLVVGSILILILAFFGPGAHKKSVENKVQGPLEESSTGSASKS